MEAEQNEHEEVTQVSFEKSTDSSDPILGTLDEVEALALAINPAIAEAESELEALRGKCVQVGLYPNPIAGVIGSDINENGNPGRYGLFVSQKQVRSDRLSFDRKKVEGEIEAQRWRIVELQQRLTTDVRRRFYDLLIAREKQTLASKLVEISRDGLTATEQLVQAKELARTSMLQSEIELENAKVILKRADNEVFAARRRLAVLIGEEDLPFKEIQGTLTPPKSSPEIESIYQELLEGSPEIARTIAELEVAHRNLSHQCAIGVPDVTWQAGVAYDFATDDVIPSFQVGVPIQRFNRNQGSIQQARNQILARERTVDVAALSLRQRLVDSIRLYQDAKIQVEAIENNIAPKAEESLRLIYEGYKSGEVDFLALLTAQRTYFQINLEKIAQLRILWGQKILMDGLLLDQNIN